MSLPYTQRVRVGAYYTDGGALAMDDHFTERGLTRPRRMPTEDRSDA